MTNPTETTKIDEVTKAYQEGQAFAKGWVKARHTAQDCADMSEHADTEFETADEEGDLENQAFWNGARQAFDDCFALKEAAGR